MKTKVRNLFTKRPLYLKDEWEVSSDVGNLLVTLRTEILDAEKFQQANFNTTDI